MAAFNIMRTVHCFYELTFAFTGTLSSQIKLKVNIVVEMIKTVYMIFILRVFGKSKCLKFLYLQCNRKQFNIVVSLF